MKKSILFLFLLLPFLSIFAQDSIRINTEPKPVSFDNIRKAFNTPYMQFGGYALFLAEYDNTKEVKTSAKPRVALLWMKGELGKKIGYYVLADLVDPMVYELYLDWKPLKAFNIKAGQMKTPLSFENQISFTTLETVKNTRSLAATTGMGGDMLLPAKTTNSTGRDIGVNMYGSTNDAMLEYALGFFQGTGINTNENNNTKDLVTSIAVQPIKGFRLGGSTYFGQAHYQMVGQGEMDDHVRNRLIVSSDYKSDRLYARAEWIRANDGGINKEGLYGTALWYFIPNKLNAVGKVDYFNRNKDSSEEVTDYTLGLNYYFYPQCRFQVNYTYSDYSKVWGTKNSNVILGQLQIVF